MSRSTILYTSVHARKDSASPFFYVMREKLKTGNRHMLVLYDGATFWHLFFNRVDLRLSRYQYVKIRFCDARQVVRTGVGRDAPEEPWTWPGCCAEAIFDPSYNMLVWDTWWSDGLSATRRIRTPVEAPKKVFDMLRKIGPLAHPSSRRCQS